MKEIPDNNAHLLITPVSFYDAKLDYCFIAVEE